MIMKKEFLKYIDCSVTVLFLLMMTVQAEGQRQMENLNRGIITIRMSNDSVLYRMANARNRS